MSKASQFKRFTLTIGLEEGAVPGGTKGRAIPREVVQNEIEWALSENGIDGATIRDCTGVWKGDTEPSVEVLILGQASWKETIFRMTQNLRMSLKQEAIMIQVETVETAFI